MAISGPAPDATMGQPRAGQPTPVAMTMTERQDPDRRAPPAPDEPSTAHGRAAPRRAAPPRMGALLRGLVLRDRPLYVHFAVTSRCNLRCRSCVIWQRQTADEIDLPAIAELSRTLRRSGCVQVSLGGGEPALRADLPEIVATFLRAGLRTRVLTNGVAFTPELARALLDVGLREVSFSLDSLVREVQERRDGTTGSFERRIRNLVALAEMLPERGVLPLLNVVVTPGNLGELPELVALAADLGFWLSVIPIHLPPRRDSPDGGAPHPFYGEAPDLGFGGGGRDDLRQAFAELIRLKRRGAPVVNSTSFLRRSAEFLASGSALWPCRAGELFLSVGPDGMVAPCHAFEDRWEVPFSKLPEALRSRAHRQEVKERVAGCEGCFRPCWAEVSFMALEARSLLEMTRVQATARLRRRRVNSGEVLRRAGLAGETAR